MELLTPALHGCGYLSETLTREKIYCKQSYHLERVRLNLRLTFFDLEPA